MALFRSFPARMALAGLFCLIVRTPYAGAQTGAWSAPGSGYVYDGQSRCIRPILGFIGAATLGAPARTSVDWVSMAPNQKSAMAERSGKLEWIPDLATADAGRRPLDRVTTPVQAFWSADAGRAAVLTKDGHVIWLVNFSSDPVPTTIWKLGREGVWKILAADSTANRVLLTKRVGERLQLWVASETLPPTKVGFSGHPAAAEFAHDEDSVFVADAIAHEIVRIRNPEFAPKFEVLLSSPTSVHNPVSLVGSSDGRRLFVADGSDKMIRVLELNGDTAVATAEIPLEASPATLTNTARDRYLVTPGDREVRPFFFLDTGITARISFVPRGE